MRFVRHFLFVLAAGLVAASAGAADPSQGKGFLNLPQVQSTDAGKKVEVTEFFAYYCPHCNAFEPLLNAWVKKQGDNIVYKRVHVERDASVEPQQRLFYTLEAMGLLDKFHARVFEAMHTGDRLRLNRDEQVFDWAEKNGIDRNSFIDTYRSFGVQAKLRRAAALMEAYHIDSWPMIAIDGRWLTAPYTAVSHLPGPFDEAQQQQEALKVMDFLVAKARAEKK